MCKCAKVLMRIKDSSFDYYMGRIDIVISDDLENKFRKEVSIRLGMKKGNMSKAVEEAIIEWIKKQDK